MEWCSSCSIAALGQPIEEAEYCDECLACAYKEGEIAQVYDDHVHCDQVYELDPPRKEDK